MYHINLTPWRERRFKQKSLQALILNILVWLIVFSGYVFYKHRLHLPEQAQQLQTLTQQLTATQHTLAQLKILAQTKSDVEKVKLENNSLMDTLVQLSRLIPDRVQLDSISMTPHDMTLIGQAANQAEMTRFSQAIFNLPYFNKQKSWTISERATDVDFKLVLKHENDDNNGL